MIRRFPAAVCLLALAGPAVAADPSLKVADADPPKEVSEAVRATLAPRAITVTDATGKLLCTVWTVKGLESKATADQAAGGLKYTQFAESTLVGVIQFPAEYRDYRKQRVKAGVYTLRLANQPEDGDHQGTAPFNEFCLLCPAGLDKQPDLMEAEDLHKLSAKSIARTHPAMMLLFPNRKPPAAPVLEAKPKDHWVVSFTLPARAGAAKADLGVSLVVIGHTMAE